MKGKIINFEILHVDEQERHSRIIKQLELAKKQGYDVVYGLLLIDGFLYRAPEIFPVDIEVKLIAGMCEHSDHLYFNYYHSIVYHRFKHTQLPSWNSNSDSFLFLGGVPSRLNRIKLLSKFYDEKMLDNSIWTFFSPWVNSDKEWCRNVMLHYTDEQYSKFLKDCDRRVDNIYENSKNYSKTSREEWDEQDTYNQPWVKDLAWINPQIFAETVLSVISEGNAYPPATNYKFLTEKTWRAIAMRHPFVFAGYPEQFNYIKSFGLKTFEEYMLVKDYAFIQNEEDRLNAVVVNTKYFMENYKQHKEEIQKDVEHNYEIFISLAEQQLLFLNKLAVTDSEKSHWFEQTGFSHLLRITDA